MKDRGLFHLLILLVGLTLLTPSCKQETGSKCGEAVEVLEKNCNCKVGVNHAGMNAMALDDCGYRFLTGHLDFLVFYIGKINKEYSLSEMQQLANIVAENKLEVIIELGGVLGPGWGNLTDKDNGRESAKVEIQMSKNWVTAGGKIDYIIFDGPVRRLLYGNIQQNLQDNDGVLVSGHFNTTREPYSYEDAADEILHSMDEWRKVYPEIKFILGCNFPNWGWKGGQDYHKRQADGMNWGDYWEVVQIIMDRVQAGEPRFSKVIVDWPYNYAIGERYSPTPGNDPKSIDWIARIRELEDYVKGLGLEFYLYTNTEEKESDTVYTEGTLNYVDLYRQRGGNPDGWNVQSWYPVPTSFGPEDQPYSMSWLCNEVIRKLNPQ